MERCHGNTVNDKASNLIASVAMNENFDMFQIAG